MRWLLAMLLCLASQTAFAEATVACRAFVNGSEIVVKFDPSASAITRRERVLGWPGRLWNWGWGSPPNCNSEALIAYLSENVEADQIDGYCLSQSDEGSYLLVPGERNFRGRCKKTTCELVNATKEEGLALAAGFGGLVVGTNTGLAAGGVTIVTHSSGAMIATGTSGYIAGTLGGIGTTIGGILSAPVVIGAAVVTVVVAGGAVYVCAE
jgi:hypothetical protein